MALVLLDQCNPAPRHNAIPDRRVMPPGTYGDVAAWPSRARFRIGVGIALRLPDADAARAKRVSVRACEAVARALGDAADRVTGRDAMPGLKGLQRATGYKRRTVQLALGVLERLGLARRVRQGANVLSREQRLELWATGSRARCHRAVFACTLSQPLAVKALLAARAGENRRHERRGRGPRTKAERATRAAPTKTRSIPRFGPRVHDLAAALCATLPQLRHCRRGRLLPTLSRFAAAGWDADDLVAEIDGLFRRNGQVPPWRPAAPAVWLAVTLRRIDHADNPALYARAARAADVAAAARAIAPPPPCPHGEPGGLDPVRGGGPRCPLCRARAI